MGDLAFRASDAMTLVRGRSQPRLLERALFGVAGSAVLLSCAAWREARRAREPRPHAESALVSPSETVATSPTPPGDPAPPAAAKVAGSAIGYLFVARDAPAADSASHADTIIAECAACGMRIKTTVRDVEAASGDRRARPALRWALEQIAAGAADALVVAELHQLAHTAASLPPVLGWFIEHDKVLVAIDVRLDTSTAPGQLTARALAHVGRWERERISAATRRGLEAARSGSAASRRATVAGVPELRDRIVSLREAGMTLKAIADLLNEEGVPTVRGGERWRPSSVQVVTGYRRPSASDRRAELPAVDTNGSRPKDDARP